MFHRKSERMKIVLGENSKITGNVESPGTIFVDGSICGDVAGAKVILGEHSSIDGNIKAAVIIVGGRINGHLTGAEKVEIKSTGQVAGDIETKTLVTSEGGIFNGISRMERESTADGHESGKIVEFSAREQQ